MGDLQELTAEENKALREMLEKHNAKTAFARIVDQLPTLAKCIGKVGRYVVYLTLTLNVLLLPKRIEETYTWWAPKGAVVGEFVHEKYVQVASQLDKADASSRPPGSYVVFRSPWDEESPPISTGISTLTVVSTVNWGVDLEKEFRQSPPPSGLV